MHLIITKEMIVGYSPNINQIVQTSVIITWFSNSFSKCYPLQKTQGESRMDNPKTYVTLGPWHRTVAQIIQHGKMSDSNMWRIYL